MKNIQAALLLAVLPMATGASMKPDIEIEVVTALAMSTALRDAQGKMNIDGYKIILSETDE